MFGELERNFADDCAEVAQHLNRTLHRASHFRIYAVRPRHFAHYRELETAHAAGQRCRVIRNRPRAGQRILGVVSRDRLQKQRSVLDTARDRTDGIGRPSVHHSAIAAYPAEGRTHSHNAIGSRGAADRAAGIFAERTRTKAACDGNA